MTLRSPDATVTTPESRVSGRFAATGGGGRPWAFSDTRLSLDPLDFATVNQLGFAEIPYDGAVRGTVASLDVLEQGSPGALRIDLAASFRPRGAGGDPSVVAAAGNVTVGGAAPFRLDGVRIEARPLYLAALAPMMSDSAGTEMLRGTLRGSAVASGTPSDLRVSGGTVTYAVGDAPPTRVDDLAARFSTVPALRYEVTGRAAPLALATLTELFPQLPFRAATLSGPFRVAGTAERAAFDLDFQGAAGRLAARGTVLPGETLRFDVTGQVEAFRSGVLLAASNPVQGPLSGTFSARGSTADFGFDVDLAHQGGTLDLGGRVRNPGDGMQFDVAGRVAQFRLGTVLGRPGLFNSPLTGPISLRGGGRQPYRFDVDLRGPVGLLDLEGWFRPGEVPSYFVTGRVAGVNPQELPGGRGMPAGNLTAELRVEGRGTTPETFEGSVDLVAQSSTLAGQPLDAATVRLAARGGILQIDTLQASFRGARVAASGAWGLTRPAAEPLRLSLAAQDLATFAPMLARAGVAPPDLAGSVALEGTVSGTFRSPAFDLSGSGSGLRYGTWRAGTLALQAQGALGPQGWRGFGNLQADGVLLAGREEFQNLRLEVNAAPGLATFGVFARRDGASDLAASGTLALEGRELRGVELQSLAMRLGDASWQLMQPSRIVWGGVQGIEVERLALRRSGGTGGVIELDGRLPPTGNTDLRLNLAAVDLADLRRITTAAPDVGGLLNLSAVLSGPVGSPEMTITGSIDSLSYGGVTTERVAIDGRYTGRQLVGNARLRMAGQEILTVEAALPMLISLGGTVPGFELLRGEPLRARLLADSVPLGLVAASVPAALEEGEGAFSADAVVTGTLDDPTVNGWASMNGGAVTVVPLGRRFTEIDARVALRGEEIRIDTLNARSDGTASLTGSVLLDQPGEPRVLLNLVADGFDVIDREELASLKVSSNLTLSGRLPEATLSRAARPGRGDHHHPHAGGTGRGRHRGRGGGGGRGGQHPRGGGRPVGGGGLRRPARLGAAGGGGRGGVAGVGGRAHPDPRRHAGDAHRRGAPHLRRPGGGARLLRAAGGPAASGVRHRARPGAVLRHARPQPHAGHRRRQRGPHAGPGGERIGAGGAGAGGRDAPGPHAPAQLQHPAAAPRIGAAQLPDLRALHRRPGREHRGAGAADPGAGAVRRAGGGGAGAGAVALRAGGLRPRPLPPRRGHHALRLRGRRAGRGGAQRPHVRVRLGAEQRPVPHRGDRLPCAGAEPALRHRPGLPDQRAHPRPPGPRGGPPRRVHAPVLQRPRPPVDVRRAAPLGVGAHAAGQHRPGLARRRVGRRAGRSPRGAAGTAAAGGRGVGPEPAGGDAEKGRGDPLRVPSSLPPGCRSARLGLATEPPIPPTPFPRKRGKGENDNGDPPPPAPSPARGEGENDRTEPEARETLPRLRGRVASLSEPGGGPAVA